MSDDLLGVFEALEHEEIEEDFADGVFVFVDDRLLDGAKSLAGVVSRLGGAWSDAIPRNDG